MNRIVEELIKAGLDAKLITYPSSSKNKPYIRVGYWKQIPHDILVNFRSKLREEELWDEDTGFLYYYSI